MTRGFRGVICDNFEADAVIGFQSVIAIDEVFARASTGGRLFVDLIDRKLLEAHFSATGI